MATAESQRHRRIAGTFTQLVRSTHDWDAPTPVEEWRARDVVDHLVTWFPEFLAAGGVELPPGPSTVDDPQAAWEHHAGQVQELLDGIEADGEFVHPHVGAMPLAIAVDRFYTTDVFMHSWDLARATGHEVELDADECTALLAGMTPMEQVLRDSGQYGPAVAVDETASAQDRLVGFIGRDPNWQPPS